MYNKHYPKFQGKPILLTRKAGEELEKLDIPFYQIPDLLDMGKGSGRKRKKGIIEICVPKGKKSLLFTLKECETRYNGNVWYLRHVGKTTRK